MTKIQRLYDLRKRLDEFRIYGPGEIEAVAAAGDSEEVARLLDAVVGRIRDLYEPVQRELRNLLVAFIELYSVQPDALSPADSDLENLYTFGRLLLQRLPALPEPEVFQVSEGVGHEQYRSPREEREGALLRNIRRELPTQVSSRYRLLMTKRRAETLTDAEHAELIRLTDASERLQAERVESLAQLAHLRHTSLAALAEDLRFHPRPNF